MSHYRLAEAKEQVQIKQEEQKQVESGQARIRRDAEIADTIKPSPLPAMEVGLSLIHI